MRKLFRPTPWIVVAVVAAVVSGGIAAFAYVFGLGGNTESDIASARAVTTQQPTSTTQPRPLPTTTTTTLPPIAEPPMTQMPPLPAGGLSQGASGDVVLAYEFRLKGLRFDPGKVDGVFDAETRSAVEAVQKLYGVERTGRIDEGVRFALSTFTWPKAGVEGGEPDRAEVDLDRQVMVIYRAREVVLITPVSTGSGKRYCGGDQGCQYATTPVGRFTFTWHHNGWRQSKLGRLYNPYYFNGGIAVHGFSSVPTHNASHGCVRIPMHVAEYFATLVFKDMPIYVVGTPAGPFGAAPAGPTTGTTPTVTTTPTAAPPSTTALSSSTSSPGATATTSPPTTAAPATTVPATTAPPVTTAPPGP